MLFLSSIITTALRCANVISTGSYYCAGFLQLSLLLTMYTSAIAWYMNPVHIATLPDTIMAWSSAPQLGIGGFTWGALMDKWGIVCIIMSALALVYSNPGKAPARARKILLEYGVVYLIRSSVLLLTSMPDPFPLCKNNVPSAATLFKGIPMPEVLKRTANHALGVDTLTCGDMSFSGHTVVFFQSAMIWFRYFRYSQKGTRPAVNLLYLAARYGFVGQCLFGCLALVLIRMHYSVDVVMSIFVNLLVSSYFKKPQKGLLPQYIH